jgi:hypothetical protein
LAAYKYFLLKNDPGSVAALVGTMDDHGWYKMANALRGHVLTTVTLEDNAGGRFARNEDSTEWVLGS